MGDEETARVSFLSYNLYCLPWLASFFSPSACPFPSERASSFLDHIQSYDILALQEVWDPRYKKVENFVRANKLYSVGSTAPSSLEYLKLRLFGGGLMIISKYPIEAKEELVFDKGVASDGFVTKGVLYAKVKVGSSYLHVFNTHLQASYGYEFDFENNPYADIRKRQLEQLTKFINKQTAKDQYPIFLMGDFNVNARRAPDDAANSAEYDHMLRILRSESYEVVDVHKEFNGGVHPVTYAGKSVRVGAPPRVGGQRLDFLFEMRRNISPDNFKYKFTNATVVPFEVSGRMFSQISDHYGASATMEIFTSGKYGDVEPKEEGLDGATIGVFSVDQ